MNNRIHPMESDAETLLGRVFKADQRRLRMAEEVKHRRETRAGLWVVLATCSILWGMMLGFAVLVFG